MLQNAIPRQFPAAEVFTKYLKTVLGRSVMYCCKNDYDLVIVKHLRC